MGAVLALALAGAVVVAVPTPTVTAAVSPAPVPEVVPSLKSWVGARTSEKLELSAGSRVVVAAGDGLKHFSDDFFSTVMGGLTDPDKAGLSEAQKKAAVLALADSVQATAHHTASRRTLEQVAAKVAADLKQLTGLDVAVVTASATVTPRAGDVVLDLVSSSDAALGAEGYELEIGDRAVIRANSTSGVFYGSRTLLQMLALGGQSPWQVSRGTARDWPDVPVRMIHKDAGRKFWEPEHLRDGFRRMGWVKLNSFKLHSSDLVGVRLYDQGASTWSGAVFAAPTGGTATAVGATGSTGAPAGVLVTPGDKKLTVSWGAPSGDAEVNGYRAQIRPSGGAWSTAWYKTSPGHGTAYKTVADRSHTFAGLANGAAYEVRVSAETGFPGYLDGYGGSQDPGARDVWYQKSDIEDLEAWAAENHVSIMPGFEFPGHATPFNEFYETGIGAGDKPCRDVWVSDFVLDITSDRAVAQSKALLEHFSSWFSGPYVHLGGEEVPNYSGGDVNQCPRVAEHLAATANVSTFGDAMAVYFRDVNQTVRDMGKSMVIYSGLENLGASRARQPLDSDIVIMDYYLNNYAYYGGRPGSSGTRHKFMNINPDWDVYLTPSFWHRLWPDEEWMYDTWALDWGKYTGYMSHAVSIWGDYNYWADDEMFEQFLRTARAVLSERTWNIAATPDDIDSFRRRFDAVGDPPDYAGPPPRARVDDGRPSHHWGFEDDVSSRPPGWFADDVATQIFLRDQAGQLHGASHQYGVARVYYRPEVDTADKKAGNSSWEFDGDNDAVGLGGVDLEAPWTMAAWVKRAVNRAGSHLLVSRVPQGWRNISLQVQDTAYLGMQDVDGVACHFNYTVPLDTWAHLAVSTTDTTSTLYVDGVAQAKTCSSMPLPLGFIGVGGNVFRGHLDDLKVWDEALSAKQVQAIADGINITAEPAAPILEAPTVSRESSTAFSVEWSEPPSAGVEITGYGVRYREQGQESWTGVDHSGTATSAVIADLPVIADDGNDDVTAAKAFEFQVRARTRNGDGPWSASGTAIQWENSAPRIIRTTADLLAVTENWAGPLTLSSVPVHEPDGDQVAWSVGGTHAHLVSVDPGTGEMSASAANPIDFESLTVGDRGRQFTFDLIVTDPHDETDSASITYLVFDLAEPPAAPAAPTVTAPSATSLAVSWSAPANTGPPISGYDVRYSSDGGATWTSWQPGAAITSTSVSVTGLAAGTAYRVQVRARNAEGVGAWSLAAGVDGPISPPDDAATAPPAKPAAPAVSPNTESAASQVRVAWSAPGASVVGGYDVRVRRVGGAAWTTTRNLGSSVTALVSASLDEGAEYEAQVRAKNSQGAGPWSNSGTGFTKGVVVSPGELSVYEGDGGGQERTYTVRLGSEPVLAPGESGTPTVTVAVRSSDSTLADVSPASLSFTGGAGGTWSTPQTVTVTTKPAIDDSEENGKRSITVTNTPSGADYDTAAPDSIAAKSVTLHVVDDDDDPIPPATPKLSRSATATHDSLEVSWLPPAENGAPTIGYHLQYRTRDGDGTWTDHPHDGTATTATITALAADTAYIVQVRAWNHGGNSPWYWWTYRTSTNSESS